MMDLPYQITIRGLTMTDVRRWPEVAGAPVSADEAAIILVGDNPVAVTDEYGTATLLTEVEKPEDGWFLPRSPKDAVELMVRVATALYEAADKEK